MMPTARCSSPRRTRRRTKVPTDLAPAPIRQGCLRLHGPAHVTLLLVRFLKELLCAEGRDFPLNSELQSNERKKEASRRPRRPHKNAGLTIAAQQILTSQGREPTRTQNCHHGSHAVSGPQLVVATHAYGPAVHKRTAALSCTELHVWLGQNVPIKSGWSQFRAQVHRLNEARARPKIF